MNTTVTFPPRPPALKLTRASAATPPSEEQWALTIAEERRRLQEDHDALRLREDNLREYEARLRAMQDDLDAHPAAPTAAVVKGRSAAPFSRPTLSKIPFETDAALHTSWEKLHRARALLETEQMHLRDERIIIHEKDSDMKRREKAVADREARVAERERMLVEAMAPVPEPQPVASEHTMSAVTRLTRAPFDMARSVFGGRK